MSVHDFYQRLTAAALLGTERQAPPSAAGTPLAELLPDLPNREEALLNAAALAQGYLGAGWQAPQSPHPPLSPAPADLWPEVSDAQQQIFQTVFSHKTDLLGELLGLMAQAKVRPVRGWVHRVIEAGQRQPELRPVALQVMDERGRWAAKFLEAGAWVTPSSLPDSIWDDGNLTERVAYLQELRGRNPAAARSKLEESWNGENHEAKAKFLEVFEQGLSLEDEVFLERVLDDKRKEVRAVAQQLLSSRADSQLTQRMIERVKPLLKIEVPKPQGLIGGAIAAVSGKKPTVKIEITLPEQFDKSWARDGLEQKNVPYGMGEKAWWLQQMLERVPPSLWGEAKELVPHLDKEWRDLLRAAWQAATIRFRDVRWATGMIGYLDDYRSSSLIAALPPDELYAQALHRLKSGTGVLRTDNLEWQFVQACPQPYKPEMLEALAKRATISLLNWQKMDQKNMDWRAHYSLQQLGLVLSPFYIKEIHPSIRQTFANPEHPLFEAYRQFEDVLEFRHQMHQAFGLSEATG